MGPMTDDAQRRVGEFCNAWGYPGDDDRHQAFENDVYGLVRSAVAAALGEAQDKIEAVLPNVQRRRVMAPVQAFHLGLNEAVDVISREIETLASSGVSAAEDNTPGCALGGRSALALGDRSLRPRRGADSEGEPE